MIKTTTTKRPRTRWYLEWCISVGKVIDDSQGLLEPGAPDASVCYQLAHRLDHLIRNEERRVRTVWRKTTRKNNTRLTTHLGLTDLQMGADDGLALGELKVFSHEEIQQGGRLRLGGAGAMVAALEDFIAQAAAQVGLTLEERTGELHVERERGREREMKMNNTHVRKNDFNLHSWSSMDLLYKEPESGEDMP